MTERGVLTDEQVNVLLHPIKPSRVAELRGMSYVEAYDVIAHLTRIFGFGGWDKEIVHGPELIFETESANKWTCAYRCTMRLTVWGVAPTSQGRYLGNPNVVTVKEDSAVGSANNQPSRADAHDLAMKSSISDALKRCAKDLGDQFGLSLYDKGSMDPLVKKIVGHEEVHDG